MNPRHLPSSRRGSALVIVLSVTVLLTIILLASFANVQLSSQLSRSRMDAFAASQLAQDGVEQAVASLGFATVDPGGNADPSSAGNWISQPGQITATVNASPTPVPLHSGLAASPNSGNGPETTVNINTPLIRKPAEGVISYDFASDQMPLQWIYVREDGKRETANTATYDADNKIVGRYAFWVDDENAKINLNTAWTRDKTLNPESTDSPLTHPSRISLSAISDSDGEAIASAIHGARAGRPYNSKMNALKAAGGEEEAEEIRKAKFSITHFNHSTDTTFFGGERIVLTTDSTKAGGRPYINIENKAKLEETVNRINGYLVEKWPVSEQRFFEKYYKNNESRIAQLSLNIVEYVCAAENVYYHSKNPAGKRPLPTDFQGMLPPIRGIAAGGSPPRFVQGTLAGGFRGVNRGVRITEMAAIKTGATSFRIYFELHLPSRYGIDEIDLTKLKRLAVLETSPPGGPAPNSGRSSITLADCKSGSTPGKLKAGEYVVVGFNQTIPTARQNSDGTIWGRFAIVLPDGTSDGASLDIVPLDTNERMTIPISTGISNVEQYDDPAIRTAQVDDPVINLRQDDWQNPMSNSLGLPNSRRTVAAPGDASNYQDMDSSGKITDISMVMPLKTQGRVKSLGELGYIHTGVLTGSDQDPSVPWRTLRLQPRHPADSGPDDTIPDWALLDLFVVPDATPLPPDPKPGEYVLRPAENLRGGLININSYVQPFPAISRPAALEALFKDVDKNIDPPPSGFNYKDVARNAFDFPASDALASTSVAEGRDYGTPGVFDQIGEIIEAKGVADGGEESEDIVRQIIDLISVRGDVFSVYSIGQSVVQLPNGSITVRGEDRLQAMVERYEKRDPAGAVETVQFRPLFTKSLGL